MRWICRLFSALVLLLVTSPGWAGVVEDVGVVKARELLQKDPSVFILDVRTPREYMDSRIEGAHLIPIDRLTQRLAEIPMDRPVLVYCAVGSRSSAVANYLVRLGSPKVYNMSGGIWFWRMRGYPVLKGPGG